MSIIKELDRLHQEQNPIGHYACDRRHRNSVSKLALCIYRPPVTGCAETIHTNSPLEQRTVWPLIVPYPSRVYIRVDRGSSMRYGLRVRQTPATCNQSLDLGIFLLASGKWHPLERKHYTAWSPSAPLGVGSRSPRGQETYRCRVGCPRARPAPGVTTNPLVARAGYIHAAAQVADCGLVADDYAFDVLRRESKCIKSRSRGIGDFPLQAPGGHH